MQVGPVGLHRQSLPERCDRRLVATGETQGRTEADENRRRPGPAGLGSLEQADRLIRLPAPRRDDPQQVESLGLVAPAAQDRVAKPGGRIEVAGREPRFGRGEQGRQRRAFRAAEA
ncbi:MAG: hypothetical protein U1E14_09265 [Geminicoccaceae bacterium]